MTKVCLLVLAVVLPLGAAHGADASRKGPTSLPRETRKELARLPRDYRAARNDLERKKQVVAKAIALGEPGIRRIAPLVKAELVRGLATYGRDFSRQAARKYDPKNSQLKRSDVLDAHAGLQQMRGRVVELGRLAESLLQASPNAERLKQAPGNAAKRVSFSEVLAATEEATIQRLKHSLGLAFLDQEELKAVAAINRHRDSLGLRPLMLDPNLCLAAAGHSLDMLTNGFFSHDSPIEGKRSPQLRAQRFGTTAQAENIATGNRSGEGAVNAWMNSPGHRANILNPAHSRIGLGRAGSFYTAMFGG